MGAAQVTHKAHSGAPGRPHRVAAALRPRAAAPLVVVVGQDPDTARMLQSLTQERGFRWRAFADGEGAKQGIAGRDAVVFLLDPQALSHRDALRPLADDLIAVLDPDQMPGVCAELAFAGLDLLCRPLDPRFIARLLDDVGAEFYRGLECTDPRRGGPPLEQFGGLQGGSPIMRQVFQHLRRMAANDASVLIYGERGSGKARAARVLHDAGRRADGPFLMVDARAAEPDRRMQALTTVTTDPTGGFWPECLERARGGTLFVNHVGDLSLQAQIPLLRALETPALTRTAVSRPSPPARLITAVDRDPLAAIRCGRLRQDLYDRLAHFVLRMPPLRERNHDLLGMARLFLEDLNRQSGTAKGLSREAMEVMSRHSWPGNLAELKNVLDHAHAVGGDVIVPADLPSAVSGGNAFANREPGQFRDIV
jgi:two-component system, NtrC family, response regulator AtoC